MTKKVWIDDLAAIRTQTGVNFHEAEVRKSETANNRTFIDGLNSLQFKGPSSEEIVLIAKTPVTAKEAATLTDYAAKHLGIKMGIEGDGEEKYLTITGAKNIATAAEAGLLFTDSEAFKSAAKRAAAGEQSKSAQL